MLTDEFDPELRAIINPDEHIAPVPGFPKICIGIFSKNIIEWILNTYGGEEISHFGCCIGNIPIYRVQAYGVEAAVFMPLIGGPGVASTMEESIPKGGRCFVYFGAAGVLNKEIAHGKLLIPTAAIRDEGLSYHYLQPSDEVELDPLCVEACKSAMNCLGYPFAEGKTWTTDAFFRETQAKLKRRKEQGCISVEMECASLAAIAKFRDVAFAQFFYATDTLDGDGWDNGILSEKGRGLEDICFRAAVETGKRLLETE